MATHSHESKHGIKRLFKACLMLGIAALTVLLAACSGGSGNGNGNGNGGSNTTVLKVIAAPGLGNPDLFNPYFTVNGGSAYGSQGLLFEPLYYVNLYNGKTSPWLASSYSWGNNGSDLTTITFAINTNIKWNDGQSLSADDVAFTFNLMKQFPALDGNGLWASVIQSVSEPDSSHVTFKLKFADSMAIVQIGNTDIVPKHVWSTFKDPTKAANDQNPVGTGPYTLKSYTSQLITYSANPNYWGTQPAVKTIEIPNINNNTTAIADMDAGNLDWEGTGWSPNNDPLFTNKDPAHNKTWFPGSNTVMLYLNLTKAPFNNLNVRKAINASIDRTALPYGAAEYAKPANPTGVVIPNNANWISSQYANMAFPVDTTSNKSTIAADMQAAGYTKDKNGFFADASGKEVSFSVLVPASWSDWAQDVNNIVTDLDNAGFNASVSGVSGYTPYYTALSEGTYDAAISWTNSGAVPWFGYQALLQGSNGNVPIGTSVSGTNFERWDAATGGQYSTEVDNDLAKFEGSTDQATQMAAIQDIENVMVTQLPVLPLTVNVFWDEYTTTHWTGFPDASNPYDVGSPYQAPGLEDVILHLKPANG